MATSRYIIDTDIIIDHLRQRGTLLSVLLTQYDCSLTAISIYELFIVPSLSSRQQSILDRTLEKLTILPFDEFAAPQAARI